MAGGIITYPLNSQGNLIPHPTIPESYMQFSTTCVTNFPVQNPAPNKKTSNRSKKHGNVQQQAQRNNPSNKENVDSEQHQQSKANHIQSEQLQELTFNNSDSNPIQIKPIIENDDFWLDIYGEKQFEEEDLNSFIETFNYIP